MPDIFRPTSPVEPPARSGRVIRPASFLSFADPEDGPGEPALGRQLDDDPDEPLASRPDLDFLDDEATDDEDQGDRYVPPYVPPQPKLDPVARGAWTALFGGPGYLFIATTLGWQVPGWAQLAAIAAFIAGFVILVSRLGDGPSRRDGPDHGAVV